MSLLQKIIVKPNKKIEKVYPEPVNLFWDSENTLIVETSAPPIDGQANARVCEQVAEYLWVKKSQVSIKRWHTSKVKYLEIRQ